MEATNAELQAKLTLATEALRKAEERALIGQFALEVMHEIRNPLDAGGYLTHLASAEAGGPDKVCDYLEQAKEQMAIVHQIAGRALAAGIKTEIGCHTFRATGITAYLKNGSRLEIAQQMAAHESARTTGLYDRRSDEVSLDEVERIGI